MVEDVKKSRRTTDGRTTSEHETAKTWSRHAVTNGGTGEGVDDDGIGRRAVPSGDLCQSGRDGGESHTTIVPG